MIGIYFPPARIRGLEGSVRQVSIKLEELPSPRLRAICARPLRISDLLRLRDRLYPLAFYLSLPPPGGRLGPPFQGLGVGVDGETQRVALGWHSLPRWGAYKDRPVCVLLRASAPSARDLSEFPISRDCGIALRTTRLSPFAFRPSAPLLRGSLPPASRARGAGLAVGRPPIRCIFNHRLHGFGICKSFSRRGAGLAESRA
jgi:hypothetical protein